MKIVILDGHAVNPGDLSWAPIQALGQVTVYDYTRPEDTAAHIGDASVVLTNKTLITRQILDACPGIRYIGVLATGYNVVDLEAASERGIPVTNIPAYSTRTVAQFTLALLLELCHHVGLHDASVKAGDWIRSTDFCLEDPRPGAGRPDHGDRGLRPDRTQGGFHRQELWHGSSGLHAPSPAGAGM